MSHPSDIGAPPSDLHGRRRLMRSLVPLVLLDVVLPYLVYFVLSTMGVSDLLALSAGAVVPIVVILVGVVRSRSIDKLALFVLVTLVAGILAGLLSGDARTALARESIYTGLIGLVLVGSLLAKRPLLFQFATQFAGGSRAWWEERWQRAPEFRRTFRVLTAGWGAVLLADAVVRVVLVYSVPVSAGAVLSPVILVVAMVGLIVWTRRYVIAARRRAGQAV